MPPTFPFLPPVLVTESEDEQAKLYEALMTDMRALSSIEEMYAGSFVSSSLQIARYERCNVALINRAFRQLFQQFMSGSAGAPKQQSSDRVQEKKLEALTYEGSTDENRRLSQLQLDEFDIEAEAIRGRFKDLEQLDRLIKSQELRRTRALRMMVEYREVLGRRLTESTGQVMDGRIAFTLDRHPELERQVFEAMQKDKEQLRWSFPPKLEKVK